MTKKIMMMMTLLIIISSNVFSQGVMKMPEIKQEVEIRELSFSTDNLEDDNSLSGLAIAYKNHSEPMYNFSKRAKYIEIILPGASTESIANNDIKCLHQHDNKFILGRTKNKTLELKESIEGLYFKVNIPETTWAKDLATSVRRGDIDKMSFGFIPIEERWLDDENTILEYGMPVREISKLALREISIVSNPAYTQTDVRELENISNINIEENKIINQNTSIENEARARKIAMLKTNIK